MMLQTVMRASPTNGSRVVVLYSVVEAKTLDVGRAASHFTRTICVPWRCINVSPTVVLIDMLLPYPGASACGGNIDEGLVVSTAGTGAPPGRSSAAEPAVALREASLIARCVSSRPLEARGNRLKYVHAQEKG